mgnify:CR=1 FL=1
MVTPAVTDPGVIQPVVDIGVPEVIQTDAPLAPATAPVIPAAVEQFAPLASSPGTAEVASLKRQLAEFQSEKEAQAFEATLTAEAQQVYREEQAAGQTDEDARRIANRHYDLAKRVGQEQQRLRLEQQSQEGKRNAATQFGREYGVDPNLLMVANSPAEMRVIGEREKRYAAQDARLKALEQGRVPPQALDSSNGSRAGSVTLTSDNIDKLWVDHERTRPGTPNPFESQYRKFLEMV